MDSQRLRILVVEPSDDDYARICRALREGNDAYCDVARVAHYDAAVAAVAAGDHDAFLISFRVEQHTAVDVLRAVGPDARLAPTLVLLRAEDRGRASEVMEAGAADCLPQEQIDAALLCRAIRYAVEHKRIEEALRESEARLALATRGASHDPLTDLPNRAQFMEALRHAIGRAREQAGYVFAVLFLDLDRFKVINDSLGHLVGDQLLTVIAGKLKACVRPGDLVARLGGDEFTILLDNIRQIADATQVADRIEHQLAAPLQLDQHEVFTTGSIGIAVSTSGYESPEELLRDADTAMYRAKARGKARYELFDPGMHTQAMALWQLEADLRRAAERQEFQVHYQPIVSLGSGKLCGLEALVRWQHPQRGLLSPADFLPLAEETGLIVQIGDFVLREACRQVREWHRRFPAEPLLTLSVNLSAKQVMQDDLVPQIDVILQETGLADHSLKLELAAETIADHVESVTALLLRIRMPLLDVYIDDFGTDVASLAYLNRYPIESLKLDRSLVAGLDTGAASADIVRSIIVHARKLGIGVVAEGVETCEQLAMLQDLGCDRAQGYLIGRPVEAGMIEELLRTATRPWWWIERRD